MTTRRWWRLELDGPHGYVALASAVTLVFAVYVCLTRLGSNPFVWAIVGLAVATPIGFWPRQGARDTGALLARGGVVIALLAAQIEIGSGPKFYRAAGDWLAIAGAFALAAFAIHVIALRRRRAEAEERIAIDRERLLREEQRHSELLTAIATSRTPRPSRPGRWRPSALVVTGIAVGAALKLLHRSNTT
jgi:hypothetical protein